MSIEANKAVVGKFLTTMREHGGFDDSLLTEDFQGWWPNFGFTSAQDRKARIVKMRPILPDLVEMTVVGITAEGDRVAAEVMGKSQLANGRRYDNTYHFLFVL